MGWNDYYVKTRDRPPRPTLLEALARFGGRLGLAIDLGIGGGRDACVLLASGWHVVGIDKEPAALTLPRHPRLTVRRQAFEHVSETAGLPRASLVNASFSLPFCHPDAFPAFWQRVVAALPSGGRFAGQFFGPHDAWAGNPDLLHLPEAEVRALFTAFEIERFDEEQDDAETPRGAMKHWHIFHIVARKR